MENNIEEQNNNKAKCCSLDIGRGCEFCGCETEDTSVKICEGCQKLHVTDWLSDYPANFPTDIFEIRFKNTRRSYYQNVNNLELKTGDIVAVEASPGHDIGIVSLTGDMVAKQMRRVGFNPLNGEFKKIYRKAKPYDIEKWQEAMALEHETMIKSRQIAAEMNLNMKIGDVEYQGDKIKAIFYYIADERVDFRELIKVFAEIFHIRVEMKQIGARQEAGRIGGLGACGRELCCASWISSFMSVTTNAARAQEISLNPQKLAGQCSKLKCCLIYEYDDYMDARKEFPRVNGPLHTMDGEYHFVKNDILARTMSFSTAPGSMAGLVTLPISRVREIMKINAKGGKPDRLEGAAPAAPKESDPGFINVIGEDSITRFDRAKKKKSRNKKNKPQQAAEGAEKNRENKSGENRRPDNREQGQGGRRQERPERQERSQRTDLGKRQENRPKQNKGSQEAKNAPSSGNGQGQKNRSGQRKDNSQGNNKPRPAGGGNNPAGGKEG